MYYKLKNTLAGLGIALSMVGLSLTVGHPPTAVQAGAVAPAVGVEASIEDLQAARESLRGMRSQLAMPFYSFAPLLPRREG
jgi:hypothetical protein